MAAGHAALSTLAPACPPDAEVAAQPAIRQLLHAHIHQRVLAKHAARSRVGSALGAGDIRLLQPSARAALVSEQLAAVAACRSRAPSPTPPACIQVGRQEAAVALQRRGRRQAPLHSGQGGGVGRGECSQVATQVGACEALAAHADPASGSRPSTMQLLFSCPAHHVCGRDDVVQEGQGLGDGGVDRHLVLPLKLGPHGAELFGGGGKQSTAGRAAGSGQGLELGARGTRLVWQGRGAPGCQCLCRSRTTAPPGPWHCPPPACPSLLPPLACTSGHVAGTM